MHRRNRGRVEERGLGVRLELYDTCAGECRMDTIEAVDSAPCFHPETQKPSKGTARILLNALRRGSGGIGAHNLTFEIAAWRKIHLVFLKKDVRAVDEQ